MSSLDDFLERSSMGARKHSTSNCSVNSKGSFKSTRSSRSRRGFNLETRSLSDIIFNHKDRSKKKTRAPNVDDASARTSNQGRPVAGKRPLKSSLKKQQAFRDGSEDAEPLLPAEVGKSDQSMVPECPAASQTVTVPPTAVKSKARTRGLKFLKRVFRRKKKAEYESLAGITSSLATEIASSQAETSEEGSKKSDGEAEDLECQLPDEQQQGNKENNELHRLQLEQERLELIKQREQAIEQIEEIERALRESSGIDGSDDLDESGRSYGEDLERFVQNFGDDISVDSVFSFSSAPCTSAEKTIVKHKCSIDSVQGSQSRAPKRTPGKPSSRRPRLARSSSLPNMMDLADLARVENMGYRFEDRRGMYTGTIWKEMPHGRGILRFSSGFTYEGPFHLGEMHGTKAAYMTSESKYEGSFWHNTKHGYGEELFVCGRRYVGGYHNGQRHGFGVEYSSSGNIIGNWVDGKLDKDAPQDEPVLTKSLRSSITPIKEASDSSACSSSSSDDSASSSSSSSSGVSFVGSDGEPSMYDDHSLYDDRSKVEDGAPPDELPMTESLNASVVPIQKMGASDSSARSPPSSGDSMCSSSSSDVSCTGSDGEPSMYDDRSVYDDRSIYDDSVYDDCRSVNSTMSSPGSVGQFPMPRVFKPDREEVIPVATDCVSTSLATSIDTRELMCLQILMDEIEEESQRGTVPKATKDRNEVDSAERGLAAIKSDSWEEHWA